MQQVSWQHITADLPCAVLLKNGHLLHKSIGRKDGVQGVDRDWICLVLNLQHSQKPGARLCTQCDSCKPFMHAVTMLMADRRLLSKTINLQVCSSSSRQAHPTCSAYRHKPKRSAHD